jgi:hypothetical protein
MERERKQFEKMKQDMIDQQKKEMAEYQKKLNEANTKVESCPCSSAARSLLLSCSRACLHLLRPLLPLLKPPPRRLPSLVRPRFAVFCAPHKAIADFVCVAVYVSPCAGCCAQGERGRRGRDSRQIREGDGRHAGQIRRPGRRREGDLHAAAVPACWS